MKRHVTFFLVAIVASLVASTVGAIEITLGSTPAVGETVNGNDNQKLVVMVSLDTEDFVGITLLSVGVLFDSQQLKYNRAESTTTDYLLYAEGRPSAYLYPAITCDDGEGMGCALRINTSDQVNVDFIATDLINGTGSATGTSEASELEPIPGGLLATLVFDVASTAVTGGADVALTLTAPGNVIGTANGGSGTATLVGGGTYNIIAAGDDDPDAGTPPQEDVGVDASMDAETNDVGTEPGDVEADTPDPDPDTLSPDPSPDTGGMSPDVGEPAADTGEPPSAMTGDSAALEDNCACGVVASPERGKGGWLLTSLFLLALWRRRFS